jgi:hypothetical protein
MPAELHTGLHAVSAITYDNESSTWRCGKCLREITVFNQERKDVEPLETGYGQRYKEQITLTIAPCGHVFRWFA